MGTMSEKHVKEFMEKKVQSADVECSANDGVIRAELAMVGPQSTHRDRLKERVDAHHQAGHCQQS